MYSHSQLEGICKACEGTIILAITLTSSGEIRVSMHVARAIVKGPITVSLLLAQTVPGQPRYAGDMLKSTSTWTGRISVVGQRYNRQLSF